MYQQSIIEPVVLLLLTFAHRMTPLSPNDIFVLTPYGSLRGARTQERYHLGHSVVTDTVDKFLGVPYAKPPTGSRRFRPPVKPDLANWDHIIDARFHGNVCPQVSFHPETTYSMQSEDCLYLDIYVPHKEERQRTLYPVMVFIHGGSFEVGSGKLYDGTVLAQLGVVVVTINYRLGALGFMSAGTNDLMGNLGIMDQVMSLSWVKENIGQFGGDADRVTVFGHSAGGASVGLLMVVPQAEGLFHGIIAQSGSAVASYSVHEEGVDFQQYARDVGELFQCHQDEISDILECLRNVSADVFIQKRLLFPRYDPIDPEFRPCIDGTWLPDHPSKLFQAGHFHKVPVITGTVQDEFANYFNGGARHRSAFDHALDRYVQNYVKRDDVMHLVKYEYTDWGGISSEEYDRGSVLTDMHMVAPTVQLAESICQHSQDIYQYHFTMDDSYHSLELNYVFGAPFSGRLADEMSETAEINFTKRDKLFSLQVMRLWTNFAKEGTPTPLYSPELPQWESFRADTKSYLQLDQDALSMERKLRQNKVSFWNDIIPALRNSNSGPNDHSYQEPVHKWDLRIHLWVFLVIVTVLFLFILLLVVLFVRNLKQLHQLKQELCVRYDKGQTFI